MIEALYEIPNKLVDKTKTWYSVKDNILYVKGIQAKYYLEVIRKTQSDTKYCILFSNEPVSNNCRRCVFDNYGRLKLKLKSHNKYLNEHIDTNSNIDLNFYDESVEGNIPYIVYKVSVN